MRSDRRYGYVCGDHEVSSPTPLKKCPGYVLGAPCPNPLRQVSGPKAK